MFGVPNPQGTIEGVIAAATAAEVERNPIGTKLVVGAFEAEAESPKEEKSSSSNEDCMVEIIVAKVEDVLVISRRQQGAQSRSNRNRGLQCSGAYANFKCYNCGQMGHLRHQCSKPQTLFTASRGRGHCVPFNTRGEDIGENLVLPEPAQLSPPLVMEEGFMMFMLMTIMVQKSTTMELSLACTRITPGLLETTEGNGYKVIHSPKPSNMPYCF